jgi:arylformamidase
VRGASSVAMAIGIRSRLLCAVNMNAGLLQIGSAPERLDHLTFVCLELDLDVMVHLPKLLPTRSKGDPDASAYYSVTHPEEFETDWKAFYNRIDQLTLQVREEFPSHLDIRYGRNQKQKLDVYLPLVKTKLAPVLVFLHGGAFSEGDRAHYGYVARPFAMNGIVTLVPSYRLLPKYHFPDQPEDVGLVLAWVRSRISTYGGDPERVYIAGHSSGAILASFVSSKDGWLSKRRLPSNMVKGCVLIGGNYDLRNTNTLSLRGGATKNSYAPTPRIQIQASPILHVESPPQRTLIALGSLEEPRLLKPAQDLAVKIAAKRASVELIVCDHLDHAGIVISLGDEKSKLAMAALNMITSR